ncbi:nucleotidyltransferase domain-containing protein [Methylomagnum ishizawai]|uniref:nucleotidyltransferase domain-containing protein n=1 Tax=Methylomagnum ishizawai TaxID=1760988 RepID=UPI001C3359DF|nr:nucleotidyltransferase family protein [Methylomagnum ishizawai]BBL73617.1 hypothetical protein MishRS11D_07150 [Methylomagnum ishizawai]
MASGAEPTQKARSLLLAALRDPGGLPARSAKEWELLVRLARSVRLLGRLEADLARMGLLGAIPRPAADHLTAARHVIEHRNRLVAWEIDRILWALKGCATPLILLKGSAYLLAGLPPARGRIFADVDLLVPEAGIGEIESRLIGRGWFQLKLDPYDDRYYRLLMHEVPPLRHRERGTEIDIHHRILPRSSRLPSEPAPLFAAARPLGAGRLHVLAPIDMVLHSLVHLFLEGDPQEGLRLRDLLDTHDLLCHFGAVPGFWDGLLPRARLLGLERPLYYGLCFARRFFATPVPPEVVRAVEAVAPPQPLGGLMDYLFGFALLPDHPDYPSRRAAVARWLIYVRAHWFRMPAATLAGHLAYKASLRLRGVRKRVDLTRLDLRQQ